MSYVTVANLSIPTDFTVEAWVNPTGSTEGAIVSKDREASNPNQFRLAIDFPVPGSPRAYFMMTGNTMLGDLYTSDYALTRSISLGVWTHLAITKSGSSFVLYVNGVSRATHTTSVTLDYAGTTMFELASGVAKDGVSPTKVLDGTIDEIRLWDIARSATDISTDMGKTITPAHPEYAHLVAYYQLDDGSGTVASDTKGTHPGNLVNSPMWVQSTAPTGGM